MDEEELLRRRVESENVHVPPFVRRLMADASEDEIREASLSVRDYIPMMWRIYERLEAEGKVDTMLERAREERLPSEGDTEHQPTGLRLT